MVSGDLQLRWNPLHFPNSQSLLVTLWCPLLFPVLFQVVCLQSLAVSACRTRALTRTDLDTHADYSLAQDDRIKRACTFSFKHLRFRNHQQNRENVKKDQQLVTEAGRDLEPKQFTESTIFVRMFPDIDLNRAQRLSYAATDRDPTVSENEYFTLADSAGGDVEQEAAGDSTSRTGVDPRYEHM